MRMHWWGWVVFDETSWIELCLKIPFIINSLAIYFRIRTNKLGIKPKMIFDYRWKLA